jgi:hypothetical protein
MSAKVKAAPGKQTRNDGQGAHCVSAHEEKCLVAARLGRKDLSLQLRKKHDRRGAKVKASSGIERETMVRGRIACTVCTNKSALWQPAMGAKI